MSVIHKKDPCRVCTNTTKPTQKKNVLGSMGGIFLILLPKCPFCFMAFSSSLMLCGEGGALYTSERTHVSELTIILSALFCLITLVGIALVYRDIRTKYAFGLAFLGSVLVMFSVMKTGGMPLYYTGALLIFFAVWLNGSLLSFLRYFGFSIQLNRVSDKKSFHC